MPRASHGMRSGLTPTQQSMKAYSGFITLSCSSKVSVVAPICALVGGEMSSYAAGENAVRLFGWNLWLKCTIQVILGLLAVSPLLAGGANDRFEELIARSPFETGPAAASTLSSEPTFEFCGYVWEGSKVLLSIRRIGLDGKFRCEWVCVGASRDDYAVRSFDRANEVVRIEYRRRIIALPFKSSRVQPLNTSEAVVAQVEEEPPQDTSEFLLSPAEELLRRRNLRLAALESGKPK